MTQKSSLIHTFGFTSKIWILEVNGHNFHLKYDVSVRKFSNPFQLIFRTSQSTLHAQTSNVKFVVKINLDTHFNF